MKNVLGILASALVTLLVLPALQSAGTASPPPAGSLARPPAPPAGSPWVWPLSPTPMVTAPFRPPPKPWMSGHRGVDLRAGQGQQILSPADGVVFFRGKVADRGVLSIRHATGVITSYEPVASPLSPGDPVTRGERVGVVQGDSHCGGECLHWGARRNGEYIDPLRLVGADSRPSVLLPAPRE